jgi:hypothetical protein
MNLLSFFVFAVFAAEAVISPIQDDIPAVTYTATKPGVSFGEITSTPTPSPSPTPLVTKKRSYTIAFLGDSMIDTMGPGLPAVTNHLSSTYPATNFTLVNYGVGATNIDDAINRISSFAGTGPDIVVLESCAYNPYPNEIGVDRHWLALTKAVDTLRSFMPGVKILIAATIAPNSTVFGDGASGIAFSREEKIQRTAVIKQYLDNTVTFAKSQHLPFADAYHTSLDAGGDGKLIYINNGDHIHYSDAGREVFAKTVVNALKTML